MTTRRRFTTSSLFLALIGASSVVGCISETASEGDGPIGTARDNLFVVTSKLWPGSRVTVCWESPGNDLQKQLVREAVEQTWEASSNLFTGGWGLCTAGSNGIRIQTADVWPSTSGHGIDLDGVANGMRLNFWFHFQTQDKYGNWYKPFGACENSAVGGSLSQNNIDCIKSIAVHEFGHALGFAHEQLRSDTPATCAEEQAGEADPGGTPFGAWDLNSVMNYCNPLWNNGGKLSATDIRGARRYYQVGPRKDINGDSENDLLHVNTTTGAVQAWFMSGSERMGYNPVKEQSTQQEIGLGAGWIPIGSGYFNKDLMPDILIQNTNTGEMQVWFMLGADRIAYDYIKEQSTQQRHYVTAPWVLAALADFNDDANLDLVFWNTSTREVQIWFMNGVARVGYQWVREQSTQQKLLVGANWQLEAALDMNRDGQSDLVFRNTATGELQTWFMEGTDRRGYASATESANGATLFAGSTWKLVGGADINNDGFVDLTLRDYQSGVTQFWFMSGTSRVGYTYATEHGTGQVLVAGNNWLTVAR